MAAPAKPVDAPNDRVVILFLIVVVSWGTGWLPMRYQVDVVAPETTLFWRFGLSAFLMACVMRWQGVKARFPATDHAWFVPMGLCLFGFNYLLMYYAAYHLPTGMLAVVFSTASLFGLAIDAAVFRRRVGWRAVLGVVLGISGLALVFLPQFLAAQFSPEVLRAFALAITATLIFSVGTSLSAATQKRGIPVRASTTWAAAYGTMILGAGLFIVQGQYALPLQPLYLTALGWQVVITTVIAFMSYLVLVGTVGVGRAAYTTVVFPLIALTLSWLFEGFEWSLFAIAGVALVAAGNVLVLRRPVQSNRLPHAT